MIQHNLFPVSIYSNMLDVDSNTKNKMIEKIYELKKISKGSVVSNSGGWHSDRVDLFSLEEFTLLKEKINECLVKIINTYYYKLKAFRNNFENFDLNKLFMENWVIVNGYKNSNHIHSHPNNWLSGVYYLSVPKNSGELRFIDMISSRVHEGYYYLPSNLESEMSGVITPENNKLVVFPSWLPHTVEENQSKEDRISISFNIPYPFLGVEPLVVKGDINDR